jgi:steroid delta-isomerase-like uncharacterized protein
MTDTERRQIEAVRQLYEDVLNQQRMELLPALLSDNVLFHTFTEERGLDGYRALAERLRISFPDLHFTLDDLIASGDRVIVRWTMQATHDGPLANVPATGKRIQQKAIVIYRFEDGKIAEGWAQMDRLGVLQQVGAAPAAAGGRPGLPEAVAR